MLPWHARTQKFSILFKLCKRTNKCLFAAGFAFYMLIYYCATNYENFRVINGKGLGGPLETIHAIGKDKLAKLKSKDAFLDFGTGDLYNFSNEVNQWVPVGNCGLHYRRSTSESGIYGKMLTTVKVYRPKVNKEIYDIFKSKVNETICYIRKINLQHWMFEDIKRQFLVTYKNAWDPHPVNISKIHLVGQNYHILADGESGPMVYLYIYIYIYIYYIDC